MGNDENDLGALYAQSFAWKESDAGSHVFGFGFRSGADYSGPFRLDIVRIFLTTNWPSNVDRWLCCRVFMRPQSKEFVGGFNERQRIQEVDTASK